MVNVVNVRRVADAIERHEIEDLGFNMQTWGSTSGFLDDMSGHECGTVACIGGWTDAIFAPGEVRRTRTAEEDLGVGEDMANKLFFGDGLGLNFGRGATPAQAVRTLRHLADTYEQTGVSVVDWDLPEAQP